MLSLDANILLYAINTASPWHGGARAFVETLSPRQDVALSELTLVEIYVLLRNPAVLVKPLKADEAVEVVQTYRHHPTWTLLGLDPDSVGLHDELWPLARQESFARRRIHDARLALSLRRQGVTEFATAHVKDFEGFGFMRVWNPVEIPMKSLKSQT